MKFTTYFNPRPKSKKRRKNRHQKRAAQTVLLLDTSGSMIGSLRSPNGTKVSKLEAAIEACLLLIAYKAKHFPQDLISCVSFGTDAHVVFPPSFPNDPKIIRKLRSLDVDGSTNMRDALKLGLHLFKLCPPEFVKNMVLLTDGYPNERDSLINIVQRARRCHVKLHTIGIGEKNNFDEPLLIKLANLTKGGRYMRVKSLQELATALQQSN